MILAPERLQELLWAYPPERRYALAAFQDIQKDCGYLPREHLVEAAEYLHMPLSQAYAMATFYHAFSLEPRGRYVIKVCDGTACHIKGSATVLSTIKQLLGVDLGGTDKDGLFTVEGVACLGACALAPAMQIEEEYFGKLDAEKIAAVISTYQARADEGGVGGGGTFRASAGGIASGGEVAPGAVVNETSGEVSA